MPATTNDDITRLSRSEVIFGEPQRLVWPPPWVGHIPFAFWLVEAFRPGCLVELGTHTGNSYCAFLQSAAACGVPMNAYAVDTWEGDPQAGYYGDEVYGELSSHHDRLYGDASRLLRMTFDQALGYFSDGSVDLLHIDGLHTYDAVKHDFDSWLPKMSARGLVLFHDVNVRERDFGVWKLWEEVAARYPAFAFDHSNGLGVAYVGSDPLPEALAWLIGEAGGAPERLAGVRRFFTRLGNGLFDRLWSQERARLLQEAQGENRRFSDMVVERDQRLSQLYAEIDRLNAAATDAEAARLAEVRGLSDMVVERDQRLSQLYADARGLSDMVVERDQRLSQLYAEIDRLNTVLADEIAARDSQIDRLNTAATAQTAEIAHLTDKVADRDQRLGLLYPEVDRLNALVQRQESELAAVYASTSWRLTAGLRWGVARGRRLAAKGKFVVRIGLRAAAALARQPQAMPQRLASTLRRLRRHGPRGAWRHLIRTFYPSGGDLHVDPGPLFDAAYYLEHNPDVRAAGDPWSHYVLSGAAEGRNPNPLFDSAWYLNHYPDVRAAQRNPLIHYLLTGAAEGRDPGPGFDTDWYLARNPDVEEAGVNPLIHYLTTGAAEGRAPKPTEDDVWPVTEPLAPYDAWMAVNRLSRADIADLRAALAERAGRTPKISLITPIYNTEPALFEELLQSVLGQIHTDWEWCLADDCSPSPHVAPMLAEAAARDPRIKVSKLERNGGISVATNAAAAMAGGDIIAFVDHDDLITPDCLAELAIYYADHPDADVVYSDDDKIDMEGRRYAPQFKPDWAPVLLLSFMYICHIFSVRRELFLELGGFRKAFDGSQDYDFALRVAEVARHVGHVPKILYHWRAAPGSTAASADGKPASIEAGRRAVAEAMERRGFSDVQAVHPDWAAAARCGMFELVFPHDGPSVTLVIPTKNQIGFLKTCLSSLEQTAYRNYDVLVVDNESDEPAAVAYLESIKTKPGVRVARIPSPNGRFSFANLNNEAVRQYCTAEYVLFLNNDTKAISPNWLSQMMGYARMSGVGAVGARLYFEDGTIQHAGIVHGYHEGLVGHAFRNSPPYDWGYMGFVRTAREYSGVTAACMLTPRALFNELGGFDEVNFAVAYNDVDYSYRVVRSGRTCVYCSTAELFHFEGKSRGFKDDPQERVNFRRLYGDWRDRWYNPNLSLENERFEPAAVRPETRRAAAVRAVMVTHNLNHEGAPITLMDLTIGLVERGDVVAHVLSPCDGPLRAVYEAAGIPVHVMPQSPLHGVHDLATLTHANDELGAWLKRMGAEVVVANTLQTFWAVSAASHVGLPAVWCQHESEPWESYFNYLPAPIRPAAYGAFAQAYRVLYVAEATRRGWRILDSRRTFQVIRHGIPLPRLTEEVNRFAYPDARRRLDVADGELVIEIVGTVCRRKGQLDIVEAFALLPEAVQKRLRVFLVGRVGEPEYGEAIAAQIARLPAAVAGRVVVTGPVDDPFLYYAAADISVCTSLIESAPRVIVEAMAIGLPIITTPVFGIPELVREDVNALYYPPGDAQALADLVVRLVENEALRKRLASKSRAVLDGQPGFAEMVTDYARTLRQAANLDVVADPHP